MAVQLIGLHRAWRGPMLSPTQQGRFAAALAITGPRPAQTCRLTDTIVAATDENRGWRPHLSPCGAHVLFTGHIDNRNQLVRELGIEPCSDGALYAAGFAAWGELIDLRAIGQFATIVIRPHSMDIRLARSPIAAPPLHYWHDHERFIVASIGSAIFATGEVDRRIDRQKIADSLFFNRYEGARSHFENISRLSVGQRANVTSDGVTLETYYDLANLPEVRLKDDKDYLHAANELLEEGVRAALDGFSRPAISLSGGYDSQAVAAFAAHCRPGEPIEAFTSVPEAGWDGIDDPMSFGDERPYVEALAAIYPQIRTHWVDAAGLYFDHKLQSYFMLTGSPPINGANLHWIHEIYKQAHAQGCDVMLIGDFGNATFSFDGKGALPTMVRRGQWSLLWHEAGCLGQVDAHSRLRIIATRGLLPFVPDWLYVRIAKLKPDLLLNPFETWTPLARSFAEQMNVERRARSMGRDPLLRSLKSTRELRLAILKWATEDRGDIYQAFALMHGIETRDPTSYRPLVEFCMGIPDNQYLRNGQSRWLGQRMLKGLVPDMVLTEKRRGNQGADWHLRLSRQRNEIIAEIDRLSEDEGIAGMLNLGALRQALVDWPKKTPQKKSTMLWLKDALSAGLTTARFIHFIEGRNG